MKNLLVTGGAGFIGSNFIHYLLHEYRDIRIINLDALTYAGNLQNLNDISDPARYTFFQGNICDRDVIDSIFHQYQIDTIVHFAAETHVDRSIDNARSFIETNINGTYNLLESARDYCTDPVQNKNFRFHHISTDEVFGSLEPGEAPFSEKTPYSPNSPYAASKAASDHIVRAYFHSYGLPVTISNCSNNYGPYQFPEKLIPLVITNALSGKPIPVYGDGRQIRDWLYVEDHCEAISFILKKGIPGETYNIGGSNQPENIEIVENICSILDILSSSNNPHRKLINYVTDRPGHDRRYAMDISKIQKELGWFPKWDLKKGLEKTVKWYLQNQDWVKSITDREDYQNWLDNNYSLRKVGR
jgi:dTDP-glucose 4,6-dehydratase